MLNFYNNLSAPTRLLIQSFLAVLGSVLAGVVTAEYQYYTQAGHLDLQAQINVGLVTFSLLFGKAMYDWVPGHAQEFIKSVTNDKVALYDALQRAQSITKATIATQGSQVQSTSSQGQIQPLASGLTPEHIQAISAQLATNLLANMASPVAPVAPAPAPYFDPLRFSAVLPAYTPPLNLTGGTAIQNMGTSVSTFIPDQATQAVQVPFPAQPAIIP